MSAEFACEYYPDPDFDDYYDPEEPASMQWLDRLRADVARQRRAAKPTIKRSAAPLSLIKGNNNAPEPFGSSKPHLHSVPAPHECSANVLFHFGIHLIENALRRNAADGTLTQSDVDRAMKLCRKTIY